MVDPTIWDELAYILVMGDLGNFPLVSATVY